MATPKGILNSPAGHDAAGDPEECRKRDAKLVQMIADVYYMSAISDHDAIADGSGTVYTNLRRALIAAIRETYGLSELKARRVYQLVVEYGPYDGIDSHVREVAPRTDCARAGLLSDCQTCRNGGSHV